MNIVELRRRLRAGMVIPAHPLALTRDRRLDEKRQRALSRYYLASGAGGLAVGVHTTQFAIRRPGVDLLEPVLTLASEAAREHAALRRDSVVLVAGICGTRRDALGEARLARDLGYDAGLVSLGELKRAPVTRLIDHMRAIGEILPVFGFYLQPAVGGRHLPEEFWRRLMELDSLVAIKIAPFDRYATLSVLRAVADSDRRNEVALYTGNDDHIILDLLTSYSGSNGTVRMTGGLLGQWAVWTRTAVGDLRRCHAALRRGRVSRDLLRYAQELTEANAAIFDAANAFAGAIPGINEVLRRQGLLEGRWCLDPKEDLSPGQEEAIDRIWRLFPHLRDDAFVRDNLENWF